MKGTNSHSDFWRNKQVLSPHIIATRQATLDLSDLKYNPSQPWQVEALLASQINVLINHHTVSLLADILVHSYTQILVKTSFLPVPGFDCDCRAYVPQKIPLSLCEFLLHKSPPSDHNLSDVHAILACVEHTVSTGSKGLAHNGDHTYTRLNKLLKCPMNLCSIVLSIHGDPH